MSGRSHKDVYIMGTPENIECCLLEQRTGLLTALKGQYSVSRANPGMVTAHKKRFWLPRLRFLYFNTTNCELQLSPGPLPVVLWEVGSGNQHKHADTGYCYCVSSVLGILCFLSASMTQCQANL